MSFAGTSLQATTDSLGQFTIASAPRGAQLPSIHTPSLDSLNAGYSAPVTVTNGTASIAVRVPSALQIAGTACGDRGYGIGGILLGRLRVDGDSAAPAWMTRTSRRARRFGTAMRWSTSTIISPFADKSF